MSDVIRRPTARAVFAEQFRMIGLSLRGEAALAALVMLTLSLGLIGELLGDPMRVDLRADNHVVFGLLGALLPFLVWKGRDRLGESAFFTLPAEHRRHVLLRVAAGWAWCMIALVGLLVWLSIAVVLSGGTFGIETTRYVLEGAQPGMQMPASMLREVRWTTPGWQWLLPFTAATLTYALASALNLATKHPLRLVVGVVAGLLLLGVVAGEFAFAWLRMALHYALVHPWGLDTVVTGGSGSLKTLVTVPEHGTPDTTVWRALPTLGAYVGATVLWSVVSALALWAVTLRFRER